MKINKNDQIFSDIHFVTIFPALEQNILSFGQISPTQFQSYGISETSLARTKDFATSSPVLN
jgi:hypothetical protein